MSWCYHQHCFPQPLFPAALCFAVEATFGSHLCAEHAKAKRGDKKQQKERPRSYWGEQEQSLGRPGGHQLAWCACIARGHPSQHPPVKLHCLWVSVSVWRAASRPLGSLGCGLSLAGAVLSWGGMCFLAQPQTPLSPLAWGSPVAPSPPHPHLHLCRPLQGARLLMGHK